jgi:hypothetical protein
MTTIRKIRLQTLFAALLMAGLFIATPKAEAAEAEPANAAETSTLDMELNSLSQSPSECTVNFVMRNNLASAIEALSIEIVLFGAESRISSIINLKAGELPLKKTKVRQFRLKKCQGVSRILINEVTECSGANLTPKLCSEKLKTTNKTKVEFGL